MVGKITPFGFPGPIQGVVTPGGAVGDHRVGNVPLPKVGDSLIAVRHLSTDLVTNADLTAEFSITADGVITNTTTVTTGDYLLVIWRDEVQGQ